MIKDSVLKIEPGIKPGTYRFLIDDKDVTSKINEGIMTFYYGAAEREEGKQCRLQINAAFDLPNRYQMTVHKEKPNGRVHTSNANSR